MLLLKVDGMTRSITFETIASRSSTFSNSEPLVYRTFVFEWKSFSRTIYEVFESVQLYLRPDLVKPRFIGRAAWQRFQPDDSVVFCREMSGILRKWDYSLT